MYSTFRIHLELAQFILKYFIVGISLERVNNQRNPHDADRLITIIHFNNLEFGALAETVMIGCKTIIANVGHIIFTKVNQKLCSLKVDP